MPTSPSARTRSGSPSPTSDTTRCWPGALFDAALSAGEAATLAAESGVGLLLFQKQEWIGWRAWLDGAPSSLAVVYENDAYMILQVRSGS